MILEPAAMTADLVDALPILSTQGHYVALGAFGGSYLFTEMVFDTVKHIKNPVRLVFGEWPNSVLNVLHGATGAIAGGLASAAASTHLLTVKKSFFDGDTLGRLSGITYGDVTWDSALNGVSAAMSQSWATIVHGLSSGLRAYQNTNFGEAITNPDALAGMATLAGAVAGGRLLWLALRPVSRFPIRATNYLSGKGFTMNPAQKPAIA